MVCFWRLMYVCMRPRDSWHTMMLAPGQPCVSCLSCFPSPLACLPCLLLLCAGPKSRRSGSCMRRVGREGTYVYVQRVVEEVSRRLRVRRMGAKNGNVCVEESWTGEQGIRTEWVCARGRKRDRGASLLCAIEKKRNEERRKW